MGSYEGGSGAGYNLGTYYLDGSDPGNKHLKQMKDYFYNSNYLGASVWWLQGAIDKRFKVGDQVLYAGVYGQNYSQAQKFFFNLVQRNISMICGYQRRNRKSTITIPILNQDDPLSDDWNAVLKWCEERDGFQEYFSEAFEDSCDTGESILYMYPDYSMDPISGDLFTDCVSYNNYLIDQYYRKQDLSDCNGLWRRRWVSQQCAIMLLPGYSEEIKKMKPGGYKDGRFPVQAELQNLAVNNLFTMDEFHYRTTREATMIIDPHTGESVEWEKDKEDPEDMMEMVLAQQPWLVVKKMQIPTVKLVISLGDTEVYHGPNLLNIDTYPCIPLQCYYEPDVVSPAWRKRGVIRNIRDAQFLYNMRKIIELQILQSQINAGWIFPVDAVTDIKCFRQSSGGDGFLIPLKSGRSPQEIQRIEPCALPQSLMELSKSLSEDIQHICGINEELLGSATDDKAGVLSMLRQGAGLTTLQTIFDKADYSQRLYGKIRMQAVRKKFSKGKVRNIIGHEADPRFWTTHSLKYSVAVEEGNYSTSQRQMELQQLLHFRELGMPIPDSSIMRAAFITNKQQIMKEMEQQIQQQQQQQMAQMQKQEKMDNVKVMQGYAKAKSDLAKEKEIMASAQEKIANIDQLEAKAEHEKMTADYELVKMMIELENLDLKQVKESFELAMAIKAQNEQNSVNQMVI